MFRDNNKAKTLSTTMEIVQCAKTYISSPADVLAVHAMGSLYVAPLHGAITFGSAAMLIAERVVHLARRVRAKFVLVFADAERPLEKQFTGAREKMVARC